MFLNETEGVRELALTPEQVAENERRRLEEQVYGLKPKKPNAILYDTGKKNQQGQIIYSTQKPQPTAPENNYPTTSRAGMTVNGQPVKPLYSSTADQPVNEYVSSSQPYENPLNQVRPTLDKYNAEYKAAYDAYNQQKASDLARTQSTEASRRAADAKVNEALAAARDVTTNKQGIRMMEKPFNEVTGGISEYGAGLYSKGSEFNQGNPFLADLYKIGSLALGMGAGAFDVITFPIRPMAWANTAKGIVYAATNFDTFKKSQIDAFTENPFYSVGYFGGSILGGVGLGEATDYLTRKTAITELPTRQATVKRQLKYEPTEKPYGYQWTIKRELMPIEKENFSLGRYQVQEAGYGEWSKSNPWAETVNTGKQIKGYAQTGEGLIPLYETPLNADLQNVYIPYQKGLYGYRPRITPAAYGIRGFTNVIPGVGLYPGLSVGVLNLFKLRTPSKTGPHIARPTPEFLPTRLKVETPTLQRTRDDQKISQMIRQNLIFDEPTLQKLRDYQETLNIQKQPQPTPTKEKEVIKIPTPDKMKIKIPQPPGPKKKPPPINLNWGRGQTKKLIQGKGGREAWMGRLFPVASPEELLGLERPRRRSRRR